MFYRPKLRLLSFFVLLLLSFSVGATEEVYSIRKSSSAIVEGLSFEIIDGRYSELDLESFHDKSTRLVVKLGIEERSDYGYFGDAAGVSVDVLVEELNNIGEVVSSETKTLSISYSITDGSLETDLSLMKLEGGHRYRITVDDITLTGVVTLPDYVYLEGELLIDRYYDLTLEEMPVLGFNFISYDEDGLASYDYGLNKVSTGGYGNPDEIEFYWSYIEGAEEYELEWTWIDNYGSSNLATTLGEDEVYFTERAFELNNTRVITKRQSYRIPVIYGSGYLLYRVRAVGRWTDNDLLDTDKRYYGDWTTEGSGLEDPLTTTIEDWPHYVIISSEHEMGKNWQYQAVYAEEGKKKEIVSYFDGSLRNRQTVTRINSNNEAVVGENVYDNQGRSAIQVLPAPVNNPALRYFEDLNLNSEGNAYTHNDFDWDEDGETCVSVADAMSTTSGASKYYSSNNSVENNWQDYVADAGGHPFVQVEYTPDNTGRIRRQSGVGADYTISGDHATEYYYLQPNQQELDRLFGYRVGNAKHYKKNLVVDANGQVSISYIDPQGRVIATALAGDNSGAEAGETKTNLLSLSEHTDGDHLEVTRDLLNKNLAIDPDTELDNNNTYASGAQGALIDGLQVSTQYASVDEQTHDFEYSVTTGTFSDDCMADGVSYPFVYDLDIDLKDDCGASLLNFDDDFDPGTATVSGVHTTVAGSAGADFVGSTGTTLTLADDRLSALLSTGAYSLTKTLKVNEEALEEHLAHYLANLEPECLPDFLFTTTDCHDELPPEYGGVSDLDLTGCFIRKQTMLTDLMPGGQYGSLDPDDRTSIYHLENVLAQGEYVAVDNKTWQYPVDETGTAANYLDEEGDEAWVIVEEVDGEWSPAVVDGATISFIDGANRVRPHELANSADFIASWEASFADHLLYYHPEYPYMDYYKEHCDLVGGAMVDLDDDGAAMESISSEEFNLLLQGVTTFSDAYGGTQVFLTNLLATETTLKTLDPYFNINYDKIEATVLVPDYGTDPVNGFKSDLMGELLIDYKDDGTPTDYSLWYYAVKAVLCGADLTEDCMPASTDPATLAADLSITDAQRDQMWNTYKQLYLSEKRKVDQLFADVYAIRHGFYNGYIEVETPEVPSLSGFMYYSDYFDVGAINVLSLYSNAITDAGDGEFPWFTAEDVDLFSGKVRRFEAIYGLYDPGVMEGYMVEDMEAEVEAGIYAETGQCPLLMDAEIFIKAMGEEGLLTHGSVVDSDLFPWLTADLYHEMGGEDSDMYPIEINTIVSGPTLSFRVENAATGNYSITTGGSMKSITLNEPSAAELTYIDPGWTSWNWSDITGFRMLYHTPGTSYDFEIIAQMEVDILGELTYKEIVLSGTTQINIGDCDLDLDEALCEKDENFAGDIRAIFTHLFDPASDDLDVLAVTDAFSELGGWFSGSELFSQIGDNPLLPETTISSTSNSFTIVNGDLGWTFNANFLSIPLDIDVITGSSYDLVSNTVRLYYVTDGGGMSSFTGDITLVNSAAESMIDLDCMCDNENALAEGLEVLFNELIGFGTFAAVDDASPYSTDAVAVLEGVYGGEVAIESFFMDAYNFDITLQDGGITQCNIVLNKVPGYTGDINDITGIYGLEVQESTDADYAFSITAFGVLDGEIVELVMNPVSSVHSGLGCFKQLTCECEHPALLAPKSCSKEYVTYHVWADALNLALADEDDHFEVFSEPEFCGTRYPWGVAAYMDYVDQFGITSAADEDYISLSAFGNTGLNHYYLDDYGVIGDYDAVEAYKAYVDVKVAAAEVYLNWNNYINDIYLVENPICVPNPLPYYPTYNLEIPCELYTANVDTVNAKNQMDIYLEKLSENFRERYLQEAISSLVETFEVTYFDREYHYTLYYYDQAGNLVQTVPPAGIDRIDLSINQTEVNAARATNDNTENGDVTGDVLPEHNYRTEYHYNSLNQLVWQNTPDGGESYFGYDKLGRLVVSQNAKQRGEIKEQFSYTKYDELGRIVEVGEMTLDGNYGFDESGRFIDPAGTLIDVSASIFPYNLEPNLEGLEEVTRTQYDELKWISAGEFEDYALENTRNRITGVYYFEELYDGAAILAPDAYDNATFYDYDVHGNVKELIQKINDEHLEELDHDLKKVEYEYDLVSGNVKHVTYQKDKVDQFIHEYEYDADNRITNVRTSRDNLIWEQDAKYFYYDHGPLARSEIGDKKVHAADYAYTIQGWLKGVNSEQLIASEDQGKDSHTGINEMVGRDVFGYSLNYYQDDYTARHGNDFLSLSDNPLTYDHSKDLYNGNIKEMFTASTGTNQEYIGTSHTWYEYDQLNRIRSMDQEHLEGGTTENRYASTYTYDSNGNLKTLTRDAWGDPDGDGTFAQIAIDNFTYHYNNDDPDPQLHNNQLRYVHDALGGGAAVLSDDLADQSVYTVGSDYNYDYDQIGQLIQDKQEEIEAIEWKVTGKVHRIIRTSGSTKNNLEFVYDAMGNRIIKIIRDNSNNLLAKTYYLRDAQGNCMSIYTLDQLITPPGEPEVLGLKLTERSIYGSSRVGTENPDLLIARTDVSLLHEFDYVQTVGDRRYELSNHLGNVLNVVTDRKLPVEDAGLPGEVDYYIADVASQNDYYPFGMLLPNTSDLPDEDKHRYGYQGSEKDNEIKGDNNSYTTHFRQLDPRVGKWLSIDPKSTAWESPYVSMGNNPIQFNDVLGDTVKFGAGTSQSEIDRINNLRESSGLFAEVYNYLDNSEEVFMVVAGVPREGVNDRNGSLQLYNDKYMEGGFHVIELLEGTGSSTAFEEFFHAYQFLSYGGGDPDSRNESIPKGERHIHEWEAEAKFAVGMMLIEEKLSGGSEISSIADYWLDHEFTNEDFQRYLLLGGLTGSGNFNKEGYNMANIIYFSNGKIIQPVTSQSDLVWYFQYLKVQQVNAENTTPVYQGEQRMLTPDAFNSLFPSPVSTNTMVGPLREDGTF